MGNLIAWGAVKGAAEGWQKNLEMREQREQSAIDFAREERLAKLKHGQAMELEETKQAGATERTGMQTKSAQDVQALRGEQRTEQIAQEAGLEETAADRERAFDAEQNRLDRESRERIAGIQAGAKGKGASDPRLKAALDRFEPKTLSESQMNEYGIPVDQDVPAVYDNMAGQWYIQQGDKYVLPNTNPATIRRAPRQAIDHLYDNPGMADMFLEHYKYLPMGYLSVLRAHDLQREGGLATTPLE